ANNNDVRVHGVERDRRIDQGLDFAHGGRAGRHVHHVGAETLASQLERGLRSGRDFEEKVDLSTAAQGGAFLLDLAIKLTNSSARSRRPEMSFWERPSIPNKWRPLRTNEGFGAMVIKARPIGATRCPGKAVPHRFTSPRGDR